MADLCQDSRPPRLEEAIRYRTAVVAILPQSPGAHLNLGVALTDLGRLDEAIAEYREALRLDKDFAVGHNNLGVALWRAAIRIKQDFAFAQDNLGLVLKEKGLLDEAIAEYREAIRIKKDYAEAHTNLGNALHGKGLLDEAIAEYR